MRRVSWWIVAAVLSWLLFRPSEGLAQSAPPPSAGTAQSVASQITSLANEIQTLSAQVSQLLKQLSELESARPAPPPDGASDAAAKQYVQALAAWQAQRAALVQKIEQLRDRAEQLERQLDQLASQAPSAAQADAARQKKTLDQIQRQLEQANASTPTAPTPLKKPIRKGSVAPRPGASPP